MEKLIRMESEKLFSDFVAAIRILSGSFLLRNKTFQRCSAVSAAVPGTA